MLKIIEGYYSQRLCILLQKMAHRRGRTANCAQYRDYEVKLQLNITHTQIMVRVEKIVVAFQTIR
jgi:hypothetical protein